MKPASSWMPVFATVLLHAALIAVVIIGLRSGQKSFIAPPKPVTVQLQQARPAAPELRPAAPVKPLPPPTPHKEKPPKAHIAPKPAPQAREQAAAPAKVPDTPAPATVAPSESNATASAAPPRASAVPATAAPPAAPVKHGVFVDPSYLATETEKWYPRQSKRYGDQGTVLLHVTVSAAGRAEKVELRKGSGYPLLDTAAIELAKSLTYRPATLDGKPVPDAFNLPITFKLND
ncbi:MAG TPA: TonB family protein [Noviherbaspirillum sp.]|nr:TonB family protein [Noviherbaspirillum sp.]